MNTENNSKHILSLHILNM